MSLLPFWSLKEVVALLSMQGQKSLGFHQKYLHLCSKMNRSLIHGFGTTWGWVMTELNIYRVKNNHLMLSKSFRPMRGLGHRGVQVEVMFSTEKSRTCGLKDAWVTLAISSSKGLHHSINFLCFTRKSETPQKLPAREKWEWHLKL